MGGGGLQMRRFFINTDEISGRTVKISGSDAGHIINVLRLGAGDIISLCDGKGHEAEAVIRETCRGVVTADLRNDMIFDETGSNIVDITLFQAVPKGDKMDFIVRKAVELGVNRVVPIVTRRTVVKIDNFADYPKTNRWKRIAVEASKQCGRKVLPVVDAPASFETCMEMAGKMDLCIIPYEKTERTGLKEVLREYSPAGKSTGVIIGPEGGFEPAEIETAVSRGLKPVSLGRNVLRTETAGMVAVSILMYEAGEI